MVGGGAPDVIEYLSIRPYCRCGQVVTLEARFAVSEVIVEDFIAQTDIRNAAQTWKETVVGKLVGEREAPKFNLVFDDLEPLRGSTQVGFGRWSLDRRTIRDAIEHEVKLDTRADFQIAISRSAWYTSRSAKCSPVECYCLTVYRQSRIAR